MTAQQLPVGREPQQGPRSGLRGHLPDSQAGEGRTQSQPLQRSPSTSSAKMPAARGHPGGHPGERQAGRGGVEPALHSRILMRISRRCRPGGGAAPHAVQLADPEAK